MSPGGRLIVNALRKEPHDQSQLLQIDYPRHLWKEKEIKSVANVTRSDVREFLEVAAKASLKPKVQMYSLDEANRAIVDLKMGNGVGAKVLAIDPDESTAM